MPYRMRTLLFGFATEFSAGDIALQRTQPSTLASISSVAGAADAPEEFAALADYAVDDFMSEAASDVEVFATTEGHSDVCAEEIQFLTRDPQAHDRVVLRLVGPRPACRTWRDEWPGAFQELHIHRRGHAASRAAYVGTGPYSIDAWLLPNFHRLLAQLAQSGCGYAESRRAAAPSDAPVPAWCRRLQRARMADEDPPGHRCRPCRGSGRLSRSRRSRRSCRSRHSRFRSRVHCRFRSRVHCRQRC